MKKTFFKNVLPAMLAFAFSGVYAIVDGYFVGQNVGDTGLASINIGYPITALIQAVGTGIGMGGAVNIAFSRGRGERENEKRIFGEHNISPGLCICLPDHDSVDLSRTFAKVVWS